jgi:hypothetical protein
VLCQKFVQSQQANPQHPEAIVRFFHPSYAFVQYRPGEAAGRDAGRRVQAPVHRRPRRFLALYKRFFKEDGCSLQRVAIFQHRSCANSYHCAVPTLVQVERSALLRLPPDQGFCHRTALSEQLVAAAVADLDRVSRICPTTSCERCPVSRSAPRFQNRIRRS